MAKKGSPLTTVTKLENGAFRIPAIISFPWLFKPQPTDKGEPKYSANFIVDKKLDLSELEDAIDEVKRDRWGKKIPSRLREPIRDGEEYDDKEGYDDSVVFFTARNERRPFVVDSRRNDIDDKDEVYPGCKVLAVVQPFAYDNESRGVGMSLKGVIKVADGERLGAKPMTVEDAMGDLDKDDFPDDDEMLL